MENEHEPAQTPPAVSAPEPEPTTEPEQHRPTEPAEPVAERVRPRRSPVEIGPRFYATLAAFLFFIAYSIAFIVGNDKTISVDFVFATARVSLIWMVLLLLVVGLVGGVLLVELYRHRRSKQPREH
jgi:uncharacterized integral membrane protein